MILYKNKCNGNLKLNNSYIYYFGPKILPKEAPN